MFKNDIVSFKALWKSCVKIACCSSELNFKFHYDGSSTQNASEQFVSFIRLSFVNFSPLSKTTNKNLTELGHDIHLCNHTELETRWCAHFSWLYPITSPSKILTFPTEWPCICRLHIWFWPNDSVFTQELKPKRH